MKSWMMIGLLLATFVVQAQPADSLTALLEKIPLTDSLRVEVLIELANARLDSGDQAGALAACREAYDLANSLNIRTGMATAAHRLGSLLSDRSQHQEALRYLQQAVRLYEELGDERNMARSLNNVGAVYQDQKQYEAAIRYMFQALKIMEKRDETYPVAIIAGNIGNLYNLLEHPEKALPYVRRSLALKQQLNDRLGQAYSLNFLGGIYEKMGRTTEALKFYLEALEIEEELSDRFLMIFSYRNIAELYLAQRNFAQAAAYLEKADTLAREQQAVKELAAVHELHARLAAARQDFRAAYQHHRLYKQLSDSVFNTERSGQIAEMQAAFDFDLKEAEIRTLSQETLIQKLELERRTAFFAGGIALAVLLLLSSYAFFYSRQIKARYAVLLAQQRWRRAQMNPHFFFNALAAVQDVVAKDRPMQAANYIAKFSRLMRQTLENSEVEFTTLADETEMLGYFLDLQQLRFSGSFTYRIEVDEALQAEEVVLPVMLLQPVVENAVEHGIRHKEGGGEIRLTFRQQEGQLCIEVEDNGVGRAEASARKQTGGHQSMATDILASRIALLRQQAKYPVSMQVQDKNGGQTGTLVSFRMPLRYA